MKRKLPKLIRKAVRKAKQTKQQELYDDSIIIYRLIRLPENYNET